MLYRFCINFTLFIVTATEKLLSSEFMALFSLYGGSGRFRMRLMWQ